MRGTRTRPSCRSGAPNYTRTPFENTQPNPPLNYCTSDKAFLVENYYENARRADGDPREISSLLTAEHALAGTEGSGMRATPWQPQPREALLRRLSLGERRA